MYVITASSTHSGMGTSNQNQVAAVNECSTVFLPA